MVCDNTPEEQAAPEDFAGPYLRDTRNPGLAHWYQVGLERAAKSGQRWLMLLDQDTTVTAAYLEEVCRTVAEEGAHERVVALVPKLAERGVMCSPAKPPVWGPPHAVPAEAVGMSASRLFAFNSGAVLRVSAVQAMGGFPQEFGLDYLDHATFAGLQARGGSVLVMRSVLEHELSSNRESVSAASARRQESVLEAERRFYARYGTMGQRCLRRIRLLKAAAGRVIRGKERGQTWRMVKWALWP
jgi:GT2 family glycosyltransferase